MCLTTLTACLFTGRAPSLARMAKDVLIVPEAAIRSILLIRAARAGLITEADFFFIRSASPFRRVTQIRCFWPRRFRPLAGVDPQRVLSGLFGGGFVTAPLAPLAPIGRNPCAACLAGEIL